MLLGRSSQHHILSAASPLLESTLCAMVRRLFHVTGENYRLDFATKLSTRFFDKNQPDSLSINRLDFSTIINPILSPKIDSIFHLRSIIGRCGQHNFATRCSVLELSVSLGVRVQVHCVEWQLRAKVHV